MEVSAVECEVPDTWSVASTDSAIVASNGDGVAIRVLDLERSEQIHCTVEQPVETSVARIGAVTDSMSYPDRQHALAGIHELANAISAGKRAIEAIAVVPHNGDTESIDLDVLDDPTVLRSKLADAPFADIVFVRRAELPDKIDPDDIRPFADDILRVVYGLSTEVPDIFDELESESYAYGQSTIEVSTVTEDDVELIGHE